MPYSLPTNAELMRGNRHLPDTLKQTAVFIEFAEVMPGYCAEHFIRIHLTLSMIQDGAEEFWEPHIRQPHAVEPQRCPACTISMQKVGLFLWECINPGCPIRQQKKIYNAGPKHGVIGIQCEFENEKGQFVSFVRGAKRVKTIPIGHGATGECDVIDVCGCLLMLDRQYSERTLAAVYRTAGHLCDEMGWKMK